MIPNLEGKTQNSIYINIITSEDMSNMTDEEQDCHILHAIMKNMHSKMGWINSNNKMRQQSHINLTQLHGIYTLILIDATKFTNK